MRSQSRPSRRCCTNDDLALETVEWVDGERITLQEYEARLLQQSSLTAGKYLLKMSHDWDWIFGISQPEELRRAGDTEKGS